MPGRGPELAGARYRHRIDCYHLGSLSSESAVKSRGRRARLEVKVFLGREAPVEVAGSWWHPQRWVKSVGFDWPQPEAGGWAAVDKRMWRYDGIEVCHLDLAGMPWWSLAVKVRGTSVGPLASDVMDHLGGAADDLVCCAYPEWLLSQLPVTRAGHQSPGAGSSESTTS